ncbi:MAG: AI-2E family transporter, partial [Planctomycetota bacterium]
MDRKVFMAILLVLAVVALLYLTVTIFEPFLLALLWAAVLATVTYRTYERILKRMRGRATPAALSMTLLVLLILVVPLLFMGAALSNQAVEFVGHFKSERFQNELKDVEDHPLVQRLLKLGQELSGSKEPLTLIQVRDAITEQLFQWMPRAVPGALEEAVQVVGSVAGAVFGFLANLFFVLLALYYMYKEGPVLVRVLRELIPMREESRSEVLGEIRSAIVASVQGGLLTALVQGLLGVVILVVLGVGSPMFWGFVMALASLVPMVGTALVWLPMAAVLFIRGATLDAVVLIAYGAL